MPIWFETAKCWNQQCGTTLDVRMCSSCREQYCTLHRESHEDKCWGVHYKIEQAAMKPENILRLFR